MCTNQKEIKNPYTGKRMYVKCGHCPACLVEKAMHRVQRIRANQSDSTDTILVSLTYARDCAPYVLRDEAYEFSKGKRLVLTVYRDVKLRYKRLTASYDTYLTKEKKKHILGSVPFDKIVSFKHVRDLSHQFNHVGVCWYPDIQKFFKRLRQNLDRNGYKYEFQAYICSEYGCVSLRPHFHVLLSIPKGTAQVFQAAVTESWSFSDISKFPRAFETAFRASSYVASYVNKSDKFPVFLETYFNTKCSYSKGYGLADSRFSFRSLLENFKRGSLSYRRKVVRDGIEKDVVLPLPQYVVNRYFPKFKGCTRFTHASFLSYTKRIVRLEYDESFEEFYSMNSIQAFTADDKIVYYDADEIHKIAVRLTNAWSRINREYPDLFISSLHDYLDLYYQVWSLYSSTVLRLHMENYDIPLYEKYDNLEDVKCVYEFKKSIGDNPKLPIGFTEKSLDVTNPNLFRSTVTRTQVLTSAYNDSLYKRKVSNRIYIESDANCEL